LDKYYPGEVCKTNEEANEIFPYVSAVTIFKDQYFDINEYEADPIKYSFKSY
jgi:hypothetical protein